MVSVAQSPLVTCVQGGQFDSILFINFFFAVPLQKDGIDTETLEVKLKEMKAKSSWEPTAAHPFRAMLYVITVFQNPTTLCYSKGNHCFGGFFCVKRFWQLQKSINRGLWRRFTSLPAVILLLSFSKQKDWFWYELIDWFCEQENKNKSQASVGIQSNNLFFLNRHFGKYTVLLCLEHPAGWIRAHYKSYYYYYYY